MMRPMKLAGSELMFGEGSLAYIKTIKAKKVSIVIGGHSMEKSGMLAQVEGYFKETGAETMVIRGVEPDPSFETVLRGRNEMLEFEPDLIVGLGGGSAMDARRRRPHPARLFPQPARTLRRQTDTIGGRCVPVGTRRQRR